MSAVDRPPLPPFVDLDDLTERRPGGRFRLLDARLYLDGRSTRAAFEAAHLPGAGFLDFATTLSDPPEPDARGGRHPLPTPERFATGLAAAGISDSDTVVAYDDAGGVMAARLVWLLRAVGVDAALLAPVPELSESGPAPVPAPGSFTPRPWPTARFASIADVAAPGPDTVLLDARPAARYAGAGPDPVDPRPGHIPGAISLPAGENVDAHGALVALELLGRRLDAAGITPASEIISSCGSGVTACHNLLMLEAVGAPPGRLYPGSFSEWSRDPERAVAVG